MRMETTVSDLKVDLLKHEIQILSQKINHFDNLRHRTKQMALTLSVAILGVGLKFGVTDVNLRWILLIAIFVPVSFWLLESFYHAYQEGYIKRFWAITIFIRDGKYKVRGEKLVSLTEWINDDSFQSFPMPDYYAFRTISQKEHEESTSVPRNFLKPKMVVFYAPITCMGLLSTMIGWKANTVVVMILSPIAIALGCVFLVALVFAMLVRKTPEPRDP
jgi:hypothetical protein